jgi:hypothetical protein
MTDVNENWHIVYYYTGTEQAQTDPHEEVLLPFQNYWYISFEFTCI